MSKPIDVEQLIEDIKTAATQILDKDVTTFSLINSRSQCGAYARRKV